MSKTWFQQYWFVTIIVILLLALPFLIASSGIIKATVLSTVFFLVGLGPYILAVGIILFTVYTYKVKGEKGGFTRLDFYIIIFFIFLVIILLLIYYLYH